MSITALPTPAPSRTTQTADAFVSSMDNLLGALPTFITETNTTAAAMNLNATSDTSTTSNSIGLGAKTFTVTAGKSFQPGMYLIFADTAAPSTNSMVTQVTSYSGTTLVVNSVKITGSGTFTTWTISFSAAPGTDLTAGPGLVYLSTVAASASATVDIETTFDSTYDEYLIVATSVKTPTVDASLLVRLKIAGAYVVTGTYSYHGANGNSAAATYGGYASTTGDSINLSTDGAGATTKLYSFRMWIHAPASSLEQKSVDWEGYMTAGVTPQVIRGAGSNSGTNALTGVRFYMTSGNITSGSFRLYGIKKS